MFKLISSFLLCFSFLSANAAVLEMPEALQQAKTDLPHSGVLKDNGSGYIYVKVDDKYIYDLFPLVKEAGFSIPAYFRRADSPGAHISVFYENETRRLPDIQEVGRVFTFVPENISHVRAGRNEYIVLQVKSPELEQLREKYGLRPLLQGHEFHITIATKRH